MNQADKEAFEEAMKGCPIDGINGKLAAQWAWQAALDHARSGDAVGKFWKNPTSGIWYQQIQDPHIQNEELVELFTHSQVAGKPTAWINYCALTGEERITRECESELASTPLFKDGRYPTQMDYDDKHTKADHIEQPREVVRLTDQDVNDAHASSGVFPTESSERLTKAILDALIKKNGSTPCDAVAQNDVNKELLDVLIRTRRFVFGIAPMGGLLEAIDAAINKAEGNHGL